MEICKQQRKIVRRLLLRGIKSEKAIDFGIPAIDFCKLVEVTKTDIKFSTPYDFQDLVKSSSVFYLSW